mgnify:CR=1 FL=1
MVDFGYIEYPRDLNGIIKAQISSGKLRSWEFSRDLRTLESLNEEWGKIDFPGVYLLFCDSKKKVYIGEAKSIKTHSTTPEPKIADWNRVVIINDGRIASQSDFNETVIRKHFEWYLIELLKLNRYHVVAQGEKQTPNSSQKSLIDSIMPELIFLLMKKNVITRGFEDRKEEEEIMPDQLEKILKEKKVPFTDLETKNAKINGEPVFIRPGSKKPKGWQVTIRGKKPGSFIDSLQNGKGYLLMPRGVVLLIPLKEIRKIIDSEALKQDTVDVWITFGEDKLELSYKDKKIDVTPFKLN